MNTAIEVDGRRRNGSSAFRNAKDVKKRRLLLLVIDRTRQCSMITNRPLRVTWFKPNTRT